MPENPLPTERQFSDKLCLHEQYWRKCSVYMERAVAAKQRNDLDVWGLFAALSAEFLVKAVLAKFNPALLYEAGENALLLASGIERGDVKAAGVTTLLTRIPLLPGAVDKSTLEPFGPLLEARNQEVHSQLSPWHNQAHKWWTLYWVAMRGLLQMYDKSVFDLLDTIEAELVESLLAVQQKEVRDTVARLKSKARTIWETRVEALGLEEATQRSNLAPDSPEISVRHKCPACPCDGWLVAGEIFRHEDRLAAGRQIELVWFFRVHEFYCRGCSVLLKGAAQLMEAELPLQCEESFIPHPSTALDYSDDGVEEWP